MSYVKQTFEDTKTVLKAEHLNHIEDGIETIEKNIDSLIYDEDYNRTIKAINHRGWHQAPENTIPAYIESKNKGFFYVEADINFTSDNVCVMLHDSTIDRTSNGSGSINSMTYLEASQYDYGSWKSDDYTGTRIPTFDEFVKFCKDVCLHPYIEIKKDSDYSYEQIESAVEIVKKHRMRNKVTWISFNNTYLGYVAKADPYARLGQIVAPVTSSSIDLTKGLQTGWNEVFVATDYRKITDTVVNLCKEADLGLETYTVNTESAILALDPYVSGVISDKCHAENIRKENALTYTYGIVSFEAATFPMSFTSDDLTQAALGSSTSASSYPYQSTSTTRISYLEFDVLTGLDGGVYKIEWTPADSSTQIDVGIHAFDTIAYTAVTNQDSIALKTYGLTTTWLNDGDNSTTFDMSQLSNSGNTLCGFRFSFGKGSGHDEEILPTDITSVTITKVS